jgi:hypothetical protein
MVTSDGARFCVEVGESWRLKPVAGVCFLGVTMISQSPGLAIGKDVNRARKRAREW